jgi:hypothetical protein
VSRSRPILNAGSPHFDVENMKLCVTLFFLPLSLHSERFYCMLFARGWIFLPVFIENIPFIRFLVSAIIDRIVYVHVWHTERKQPLCVIYLHAMSRLQVECGAERYTPPCIMCLCDFSSPCRSLDCAFVFMAPLKLSHLFTHRLVAVTSQFSADMDELPFVTG